MSGKIRRFHSPQMKAQVAIEALREDKTVAEIAAHYAIHPQLVSQWKHEFIENASLVFNRKKKDQQFQEELKEKEKTIEALYKEVGQLTLEVNWTKKKVRQFGLN